MTPQKTELCENITLYTVKTEKFKTGMLSLSVQMKRSAQSSAYNNIIAGVMRRGTTHYPSVSALNRRLDELYAGTIDVKTHKCGENEMFTLSAELLNNRFSTDGTDIADGMLEVMSSLLFSPLTDSDGAFREKSVAAEKKLSTDALRAEINNPRVYATVKLFESMNRNNKSRATTKQLIDIIDASDRISLTEHYNKNILNQKIDFFYVGSLDKDELAEKILKYFKKDKEAPAKHTCPMRTEAPEVEPIYLTEDMAVSQGKLAMGFRTGVCLDDDRYYAAVVMNEILGGSPASKLFLNVREALSLCYYCSSSYNMYTGDLIISSGIEVEDRERAEAAILSELDDIKRGNISDTEFKAAKKSLENSYRQMYDNPFDLHGFYAGRELFGISDTVEQCREKLAEVTLDEVISIAQNVILDTVFFLRGTLNSEMEDCDGE